MPRLNMSHLTLFSGPVIERDGSERMYVGAYIPETVDSHDRMRVQECIGFLAVPNYDPTTYPQPRDGWIARPARESEETIEDVFTTVCETGDYHQLSEPIERPVLEQLIGKEAVVPPKKAS